MATAVSPFVLRGDEIKKTLLKPVSFRVLNEEIGGLFLVFDYCRFSVKKGAKKEAKFFGGETAVGSCWEPLARDHVPRAKCDFCLRQQSWQWPRACQQTSEQSRACQQTRWTEPHGCAWPNRSE